MDFEWGKTKGSDLDRNGYGWGSVKSSEKGSGYGWGSVRDSSWMALGKKKKSDSVKIRSINRSGR